MYHKLQFECYCCWKKGRFIYIHSCKKLDKIYTGEIHVLVKMYKAEYTTPMGLLPDHVVFYKIDILEI